MPGRRFVFDTNIYRYATTYREFALQVWEEHSPASASAVVLSELWRSAQKSETRELVKELEQRFRKFLFAPSYRDWRQVGEYLATRLPRDGRKLAPELLGHIRKEQNDALIALSAWNRGFVVVTCDNDFEPIRAWAKQPPESLVRLSAPTPTHPGGSGVSPVGQ